MEIKRRPLKSTCSTHANEMKAKSFFFINFICGLHVVVNALSLPSSGSGRIVCTDTLGAVKRFGGTRRAAPRPLRAP